MIAGLEVPHVDLHATSIDTDLDLDLANADPNASAESFDEEAERIGGALAKMRYEAAT